MILIRKPSKREKVKVNTGTVEVFVVRLTAVIQSIARGLKEREMSEEGGERRGKREG